MLFRRIFSFTGITLLLASPAAAQFGLGKKKQTFQDLNEQAHAMQDASDTGNAPDMAALEKLMADLGPDLQNEMGDLTNQLDEVMKMMAEMTPEQMEAQMKEAMQKLQSGDMFQDMMKHQDEIIKTLEAEGQVSPEELEKFKKDPEYFEQKMKESFGALNELFSDPEMLESATKNLQGISEMYNNPNALGSMMEDILADFDDDEKIEEVRQMFLNDPTMADNPMMKQLFDNEEMSAALKDPKKWRDTVKEGQGLLSKGLKQGVGTEEL